jgi:hypothetical protein
MKNDFLRLASYHLTNHHPESFLKWIDPFMHTPSVMWGWYIVWWGWFNILFFNPKGAFAQGQNMFRRRRDHSVLDAKVHPCADDLKRGFHLFVSVFPAVAGVMVGNASLSTVF